MLTYTDDLSQQVRGEYIQRSGIRMSRSGCLSPPVDLLTDDVRMQSRIAAHEHYTAAFFTFLVSNKF